MSIIAFLIGIALPTLNGMVLLTLLEGTKPALFKLERAALGFTLGLTATMFLVFVGALLHLPIALPLFIGVQVVVFIALMLLRRWMQSTSLLAGKIASDTSHAPQWITIILQTLLLWTAVKFLITGVVFLLLTPSYMQDTLSNWDLRGKVFYADHTLTLTLPGEDPTTSPLGVSSYPPAVPLAKAWLASLAGNWNDPLVNSIHMVWYLCAIALVYYAIRRFASKVWALLGAYLIGSLPLYLMHGVTAYADAFLSAHIIAAVGMLFFASRATNDEDRMSYLRIAAIATALLAFTKNEGLILYLPPILLLIILLLLYWKQKHIVQGKTLFKMSAWAIGCLIVIAVPWLIFKWSHHLTFGNGKPFTSLGLSWQTGVLTSISINTFFEGNWLLLYPLLFVLIIWRWKHAFTSLIMLTTFFLIIYLGQGSLYLFTHLSIEALKQTGYARGLVQLTPVAVLLTTLLLKNAWQYIANALATSSEMQNS